MHMEGIPIIPLEYRLFVCKNMFLWTACPRGLLYLLLGIVKVWPVQDRVTLCSHGHMIRRASFRIAVLNFPETLHFGHSVPKWFAQPYLLLLIYISCFLLLQSKVSGRLYKRKLPDSFKGSVIVVQFCKGCLIFDQFTTSQLRFTIIFSHSWSKVQTSLK